MSATDEGRKVIPLRELRRSDAGIAGSRAANLGELAAAGLPVPGRSRPLNDNQRSRGLPKATIIVGSTSVGRVAPTQTLVSTVLASCRIW